MSLSLTLCRVHRKQISLTVKWDRVFLFRPLSLSLRRSWNKWPLTELTSASLLPLCLPVSEMKGKKYQEINWHSKNCSTAKVKLQRFPCTRLRRRERERLSEEFFQNHIYWLALPLLVWRRCSSRWWYHSVVSDRFFHCAWAFPLYTLFFSFNSSPILSLSPSRRYLWGNSSPSSRRIVSSYLLDVH